MYQKILIPTDGSSMSTAATRAGVALARELGAEIMCIFVAPEYQYPIYVDMIPPNYPTEEDHKASMRKVGEDYLAEIQKAAAEGVPKVSSLIVFSDSPAGQIVEAAEENHCDLIFIGSHGRSGWGQLLLGSVTAKVLATCQIPVLVYRSKRPSANV
jgi:nucleotide-binding universal stress UspA family protein